MNRGEDHSAGQQRGGGNALQDKLAHEEKTGRSVVARWPASSAKLCARVAGGEAASPTPTMKSRGCIRNTQNC